MRVLRSIDRCKFIICGDVNVRSPIWFDSGDEDDDRRGEVFETFLIDRDLRVYNKLSEFTTFQTMNGKSNVDITFGNFDDDRVLSWEILDGITTSDYRVHFNLRLHDHDVKNREYVLCKDYNSIDPSSLAVDILPFIEYLMNKYPFLYSTDRIDAAINEFYSYLE